MKKREEKRKKTTSTFFLSTSWGVPCVSSRAAPREFNSIFNLPKPPYANSAARVLEYLWTSSLFYSLSRPSPSLLTTKCRLYFVPLLRESPSRPSDFLSVPGRRAKRDEFLLTSSAIRWLCFLLFPPGNRAFALAKSNHDRNEREKKGRSTQVNPWLRLKTLYTQKRLSPSAFRFPRQPACRLNATACLFFPPPRRPAAVKCRAWALISFQFCLLVLHSQRFFSFSFERSRLESPRERHPISGILHSLSVSRSIRTSLPSFSNPPATFFFRRFLAAWERNAVVTQLADEFVLRPAKVCLVDRVELFTWPRTSDRDVLDTNLVRRTSFERVAPLLWEPPACCQ